MAVIPEELTQPRRPYAAAANVIAVLSRVRSRTFPAKIDGDFLRVAQVPEIVFGRVKEALRFLELIDAGDRPTDNLRALAGAPEESYRELLSGIVRHAYRDDFERVNPSEDSQAQIVAAFQPYEPRSQTNRMVMLFLGLCREAGIPLVDAPRERKMKPRSTTRSSGNRGRTEQPASNSMQHVVPFPAFPPTRILFGLSEEDVAVLGEAEFQEVWTALGKVARARARARQPAPQESPPVENPVDGEVEPSAD